LVRQDGNPLAQKILLRVFQPTPAFWRGLGEIAASGLRLRKEFSSFDAGKVFYIREKKVTISAIEKRCRCAEVLKGLVLPSACRLFARVCRPENPVGPCMVSHEGTCNAYYKYH
jgi:hydrogenase expression/formation protein HypD